MVPTAFAPGGMQGRRNVTVGAGPLGEVEETDRVRPAVGTPAREWPFDRAG